jgi:hypothetical protein
VSVYCASHIEGIFSVWITGPKPKLDSKTFKLCFPFTKLDLSSRQIFVALQLECHPIFNFAILILVLMGNK